MPSNYLIGEISQSFESGTTVVKWRIPYSSLFLGTSYHESFSFPAFNSKWRLCISNKDSIAFQLVIINSTSPIHIYYEWVIKKADGVFQEGPHGTKKFAALGCNISHLSHKIKLEELMTDVTSSDILTVICFMTLEHNVTDIPCGCRSPPKKRKRIEEDEVPKRDSKHIRMLIKNMEDLYTENVGCDLKIRIKKLEFPAHKAILRSRSPVFAAMFNNDMKENKTGIITLDDCDPNVFDEFLHFLYCGQVTSELSEDNVCGLYYLADKYDLPDFKADCREFMWRNITLKNFFDVVSVADRHDDSKVMDSAIVFFAENAESILLSSKWKKLLLKNMDLANKLYLRATRSIHTEKWM